MIINDAIIENQDKSGVNHAEFYCHFISAVLNGRISADFGPSVSPSSRRIEVGALLGSLPWLVLTSRAAFG
jgi:hypothetical protein